MKQRKHRYQFPDGFLWGSSTSGPQSEGTVPGDGKGPSNWDYWFSIESAKFHHQIGPEKPQPFMKTIRVTLPFERNRPHDFSDLNPVVSIDSRRSRGG